MIFCLICLESTMNRRRRMNWTLAACLILACRGGFGVAEGGEGPRLVIHEIAWMGMKGAPSQQWMELYNPGGEPVDLTGWRMRTRSGSVDIELSGEVAGDHTWLLARKTRGFLPGLVVDQEWEGRLSEQGEVLELWDAQSNRVDAVDAWHAGDAGRAATMQRADVRREGTDPGAWTTSTVRYDRGQGTPGFRMPSPASGQQLYQVYHGPDTLTVYFNQSAQTALALEGNEANHRIDLEERVIDRIRQARQRIDIAAYEINLTRMMDELRLQAARGVEVRLIVDAKAPEDDYRDMRYARMRLHLEQLRRGLDGRIGTDDDVHLFANSPIFAVRESGLRERHGLPPDPGGDLEWVEVTKGSRKMGGHLLAEGALRDDERYYVPGGQMHNKFIVIDDYRVLTGSMNFTETDVYGTPEDRDRGRMRGNANNVLDIHSRKVAAIYRDEFDQMWGGGGVDPDPARARFRGNKVSGLAPHLIDLGGIPMQIYFSPGYDVIPAMVSYVAREARESFFFCIFAWSDSELDGVVREKWEGRREGGGDPYAGFRVKGVFERLFWNQPWSATVTMTGSGAGEGGGVDPEAVWSNPPPVYRDREVRRLHHKYMLIDADTGNEPTVITGSANWSRNANAINDENTLFIRDRGIANQYLQEFAARYTQAGGAWRN